MLEDYLKTHPTFSKKLPMTTAAQRHAPTPTRLAVLPDLITLKLAAIIIIIKIIKVPLTWSSRPLASLISIPSRMKSSVPQDRMELNRYHCAAGLPKTSWVAPGSMHASHVSTTPSRLPYYHTSAQGSVRKYRMSRLYCTHLLTGNPPISIFIRGH